MKTYIGTKIINATPMTRLAYNEFRGWTLPENERGEDEGYLVEYLDGGEPNTAQYEGYVSWSPKAQFDNAYRETGGLSFGLALDAMAKGHKVARAGWNGKGMWIAKGEGTKSLPAEKFWNKHSRNHAELNGGAAEVLPYAIMKTATGEILMGWLASQSDMFADDWGIVNTFPVIEDQPTQTLQQSEEALEEPLKIGDQVISTSNAMRPGVIGIVEVIRSHDSVGVRTDGGDLWHECACDWRKVA